MNKKVMRILAILLLAMMVVCSLSQFAFAADEETPAIPDSSTKEYMATDQFNDKGNRSGIPAVQGAIGSILAVVRVVAVGVAVIMLIVLAIKYISAAPSEKAEIKKSATIYIVGAVLLFAASGILGIIQGFAENLQ